jgi:hypothetical protein
VEVVGRRHDGYGRWFAGWGLEGMRGVLRSWTAIFTNPPERYEDEYAS